jgi:hypothetical protein
LEKMRSCRNFLLDFGTSGNIYIWNSILLLNCMSCPVSSKLIKHELERYPRKSSSSPLLWHWKHVIIPYFQVPDLSWALHHKSISSEWIP